MPGRCHHGPVTGSQACARCGGDADFDIAALWLCMDCYHIAGSTCAGIGRPPAEGSEPAGDAPGNQVC